MASNFINRFSQIIMKKISFLILFLFLTSIFSFAQTREVQQIKITSTWGGLGTPEKSEILIIHKPKGYYAKGNKIEKRLVDNLLNAIDEPEIKEFQAANLGITQEWLNTNAEPGVKEYADYYYSFAAPNQKELYLSSFKNLQLIEKVLPSVLSGGWTDDYPGFAIEITESNGDKTVASSYEQPTFMLPWEVVENGRVTKTYNANISRAIVAFLPKKFANKERLSGEDLRRVLATFIMRYIKDDWKRLESENKAGDTLTELKKTYAIVSAQINPYHGVDFGLESGKDKPSETNLNLLLRKEDFPKSFSIQLKLPVENEKVKNLEIFQSKIDTYQNLVFSVSWLKNYIESGKRNVELRFITNRSFSEKAMKKFAEDMNKIGKSELVAEVEKEKENVALIGVGGGLEYYQSYWIVLPNKNVILWRYRYAVLLNWSEKDFETNECTDNIAAGLKCIGAVISPDGNIISK